MEVISTTEGKRAREAAESRLRDYRQQRQDRLMRDAEEHEAAERLEKDRVARRNAPFRASEVDKARREAAHKRAQDRHVNALFDDMRTSHKAGKGIEMSSGQARTLAIECDRLADALDLRKLAWALRAQNAEAVQVSAPAVALILGALDSAKEVGWTGGVRSAVE